MSPDKARQLADEIEKRYRMNMTVLVNDIPELVNGLHSMADEIDRLVAERQAVLAAFDELRQRHSPFDETSPPMCNCGLGYDECPDRRILDSVRALGVTEP